MVRIELFSNDKDDLDTTYEWFANFCNEPCPDAGQNGFLSVPNFNEVLKEFNAVYTDVDTDGALIFETEEDKIAFIMRWS
jgi:hypothetical protein